MEIFCAEKVAVVEDRSNKFCRCGEKLELVRAIDRRRQDTALSPAAEPAGAAASSALVFAASRAAGRSAAGRA